MNTTSALDMLTRAETTSTVAGVIPQLEAFFTTSLTILIPVIIGVAMLFAGYYTVKSLGRKRV